MRSLGVSHRSFTIQPNLHPMHQRSQVDFEGHVGSTLQLVAHPDGVIIPTILPKASAAQVIQLVEVKLLLEGLSTRQEDIKGMIRAAGELDCFGAHIRLREPDKSEDKAE
ncbi:hypothetical protein GW17_00054160 [Ensete ventricosum]|nr:hypothetical protein GW17_00054160 [Ensete ventricosum]